MNPTERERDLQQGVGPTVLPELLGLTQWWFLPQSDGWSYARMMLGLVRHFVREYPVITDTWGRQPPQSITATMTLGGSVKVDLYCIVEGHTRESVQALFALFLQEQGGKLTHG